jgi:hypothetical protein
LVRNDPLGASGVLRRDLALAKDYLTEGGPGELARRAVGRLRRLRDGRPDGT